ncbi:hypothetical protein CPT_Silence59 [Bacillus phage Silence]|nr:hypothetical protein CPT_Silence59 [Bacillus phage Silence]
MKDLLKIVHGFLILMISIACMAVLTATLIKYVLFPLWYWVMH